MRTLLLHVLCVLLVVSGGCESKQVSTAIRVVVDSDLQVGSELTRLDVRIFDPAGEIEQRKQSFALSAEAGQAARFTLPMTFRLAPESQSSS